MTTVDLFLWPGFQNPGDIRNTPSSASSGGGSLYPVNVSDATALSDVLTRTLVYTVGVSESSATSEVMARLTVLARTVADVLNGDATATTSSLTSRTSTDSVVADDAVAQPNVSMSRSATDDAAISDLFNVLVSYGRALNEAITGIQDGPLHASTTTRQLAEALTTMDTGWLGQAHIRSVTDITTASESLVVSTAFARALAEHLGTGDTSLRTVLISRTDAEVSTGASTVLGSTTTNRAPADAVTTLDTVDSRMRFAVAVDDQLALIDGLLRRIAIERNSSDLVQGSDLLIVIPPDHSHPQPVFIYVTATKAMTITASAVDVA